jgi:hypothetical protein
MAALEIPPQVTHRELVAIFRAAFANQEKLLNLLHQQRDVKGYCLAARAFDVEIAGHVPLLLQAFEAVLDSLEEKHTALMEAEERIENLLREHTEQRGR